MVPRGPCQFLASDAMQDHLESDAAGSAVPSTLMKEVAAEAIPIPDATEQNGTMATLQER